MAANAPSSSSSGASTPARPRTRRSAADDARLPVDQRAVAVEGERLEAPVVEIGHVVAPPAPGHHGGPGRRDGARNRSRSGDVSTEVPVDDPIGLRGGVHMIRSFRLALFAGVLAALVLGSGTVLAGPGGPGGPGGPHKILDTRLAPLRARPGHGRRRRHRRAVMRGRSRMATPSCSRTAASTCTSTAWCSPRRGPIRSPTGGSSSRATAAAPATSCSPTSVPSTSKGDAHVNQPAEPAEPSASRRSIFFTSRRRRLVGRQRLILSRREEPDQGQVRTGGTTAAGRCDPPPFVVSGGC